MGQARLRGDRATRVKLARIKRTEDILARAKASAVAEAALTDEEREKRHLDRMKVAQLMGLAAAAGISPLPIPK